MKIGKMKTVQLISCLYAFILTLIFVVLFICAGIGFGVLSDRSISRNINESNYYNKVYEELYAKATQEMEEVGFPQSVLKEVITLERVYISSKNYLEDTLNSEDAVIKTDRLKEELKHNLDQYLKAKGVARSDELNLEVDKLVYRMEKDYKAAINLPLLPSIMEYRTKFLSTMLYVIPILILLAGAFSYFLLKMYHYIHRGLRFIAYAMISASGLVLGMSGYLMITKAYEDVMAEPEYYQSFLRMYLRWDIIVFLYIGGLGLILALVLISFISYLKNRMKNN
jgi:hypothetical protein